MENLIKMDDLGVPLFFGNHQGNHDLHQQTARFAGACSHGGIDYADSTGDEGTTGGVPGGFAGGDWGDLFFFFFPYDLVP